MKNCNGIIWMSITILVNSEISLRNTVSDQFLVRFLLYSVTEFSRTAGKNLVSRSNT